MPPGLDQLLREASQLHRLVDQVDVFIREHEASCTYPPDAERFLRYVGGMVEATKHFLQARIVGKVVGGEPKLGLPHFRRKVASLSDSWARLHDFVKPVVDAHTLRVPTPLLALLNQQVRTLPELEGARLTTELGPALNYLQRGHTRLRDTVTQLGEALGGRSGSEFLNNFGILGLPYSQGSGLFMNCLLYHELGHYVFEQRNLRSRLDVHAHPLVQDQYPDRDDRVHQFLLRMLRPWSEEIFCDLFALRMLGPAYTCIVAELFYLIGSLEDDEVALYGGTHPSPVIRLKEQTTLLKELHWWEHVQHLGAPLINEIEGVANRPLPEQPYRKDFPLPVPGLVDLFRETIPFLCRLASDMTGGRGAPEEDYGPESERIRRCLAHGVVPSALYDARQVGGDRFVTLINAAYFFQLVGLRELFRVVAKSDWTGVAQQAQLRQRVEEWTLKAIEDLLPGRIG